MLRASGSATSVVTIAGLRELWAETLGDPRICVAILDGPVDRSHPSLAAANLTQLETLVSGSAGRGPACQHGTHVASVLFGQHDGLVKGIAPRCRGLVVPVFTDGVAGELAPCSQIDLARAILRAAGHGAHVLNISGGQFTPSGAAHPLLADAVRYCAANGVLIVAAAGNEGCDCLHVPAALPSVIAVGAMDAQGLPVGYSNWGQSYRTKGILAPGEDILGAAPGGGTVRKSGTSYAAAIVSGIAALFLSLLLKRGQVPDSHAVRAAILHSAFGCDHQPVSDCRRLLAGRLNVNGAILLFPQGVSTVSDPIATQENTQQQEAKVAEWKPTAVKSQTSGVLAAAHGAAGPDAPIGVADQASPSTLSSSFNKDGEICRTADSGRVTPSACACDSPRSVQPSFVYALGQLNYDFGTEARRDSILQHIDEQENGVPPNPNDPKQLLGYLDNNPWDAAAIIWTLNLDGTPIYAVQVQGSFAGEIGKRLRQFLREALEEGVERVSIPGVVAGKVRLLTGQVVPFIHPDLRGMYSWTTSALVQAVSGSPPAETEEDEERKAFAQKSEAVRNFLERVYHEIRNLGITPHERAINFAATNAFQVEKVFESALTEAMDLDRIDVERSPICRPESDCWDVKLTFFDPRKVFERARKVYRFTIDVSDVVPVTVGKVRSWFVR